MPVIHARLPIRSARREQWWRALISTAALVAFLAFLACGKPPQADVNGVPPTDVIGIPPCGTGIADEDLSGTCREKPYPSPGALEYRG